MPCPRRARPRRPPASCAKRSLRDPVLPAAAAKEVLARSADQLVQAGPSEETVIARATEELVAAPEAADDVLAAAAADHVDRLVADDHVPPGGPVQALASRLHDRRPLAVAELRWPHLG